MDDGQGGDETPDRVIADPPVRQAHPTVSRSLSPRTIVVILQAGYPAATTEGASPTSDRNDHGGNGRAGRGERKRG